MIIQSRCFVWIFFGNSKYTHCVVACGGHVEDARFDAYLKRERIFVRDTIESGLADLCGMPNARHDQRIADPLDGQDLIRWTAGRAQADRIGDQRFGQVNAERVAEFVLICSGLRNVGFESKRRTLRINTFVLICL